MHYKFKTIERLRGDDHHDNKRTAQAAEGTGGGRSRIPAERNICGRDQGESESKRLLVLQSVPDAREQAVHIPHRRRGADRSKMGRAVTT